jgi:hypothetical protein
MKMIVAAALAAPAFVGMTAAQTIRVTLYEHENFGGASMTFVAPGQSTCFNIWGCFNDRATSAKWTGFDSSSFEREQLVFYDAADCKGAKYVVGPGEISKGVPNYGAAMNDRISSFSTFTTFTGIKQYTGYKCGARRVGNETDAALEPMSPLPAGIVG